MRRACPEPRRAIRRVMRHPPSVLSFTSRRRWVARAALSGLLIATGCGATGCGDNANEDQVPVAPMPTRTAAQNDALRAMAMDLARAQACPALEGRFLPLPEDPRTRTPGELPTTVGRLWVDACTVERHGDDLAMHLGGRGWQWVEESGAGPLGSSFTVRGTVRMEATVDLEGSLDLRYDERAHRASVVLTPLSQAQARVVPIGAIPVTPDGGWSGLIGGLGGLLGASPQASARPMLEERAAADLRRELAQGATVVLDLCTSQVSGGLGALGDSEAPPARPWPDDGHLWLDNSRSRLHPGMVDISGPWPTGDTRVVFELELEEGSGADVAIVCRQEAERVAAAALSGVDASARTVVRRAVARPGAPIELSVEESECAEPHFVVAPLGSGGAVTYRSRVRHEGDEADALVRCR